MINLKQFFCEHVWESKDIREIRIQKEETGFSGLLSSSFPAYRTWKYFAEYQECLKCKKQRIVEIKEVVG